MGLKGHWMDQIDDTVIMGGAPFGFLNFPDELYRRGVRGVVNLCQEYRGPRWKYDTLGMTELWLPTTDHFEPSLQQLQDAVNFIQSYAHRGERVYVHCRAGHGRSAAAVLAWMTIKSRGKMSLQELNQALCRKRMVRRTLWKQPNMRAFYRYVYGRSDKFEDQVDESMTDTESDQDEAPQDTTSRGEL
jgi:atypical dual specificity phosphatase